MVTFDTKQYAFERIKAWYEFIRLNLFVILCSSIPYDHLMTKLYTFFKRSYCKTLECCISLP